MAIKHLKYDGNDFIISYKILNPKEEKDLIILHGWGSNKEIMEQAFLNSFKEYRHIYIDLPGFGGSTNDTMILNSLQYSEILSIFLTLVHSKRNLIIGHSFGGKIAILLYPKKLILLSSAGYKERKPLFVKAKIFTSKLIKPFKIKQISKLLTSEDGKQLSTNMYETFKLAVNEPFMHRFREYEYQAILFWGKEDTATTVNAGIKIQKAIKNSKLFVLEGDHFFFMKQAPLIEKLFKENNDT